MLAALKLLMVLAFPKLVPPAELVVSKAALINAEPDSEMEELEVRVALPVVLNPAVEPRSSVKLAMVKAFTDLIWVGPDKAPPEVVAVEIVVNALELLDAKAILLESRSNKLGRFVPNVRAPV